MGKSIPVFRPKRRQNHTLWYVLKFFRNLAGRCGSVVVRSERLGYESPRWNPGLGFTFFLIRNTQNQVKNFPSVLEMAATFYERDNCGSVYLSGLYKGVSPPGPSGPCKICSLMYHAGFSSYRGGTPEAPHPCRRK